MLMGPGEQTLKERGLEKTSELFDEGLALFKLKKYEEAALIYNEVLKTDSDNVAAWFMKSISLRALGKNHEAEQALRAILMVTPLSTLRDQGQS